MGRNLVRYCWQTTSLDTPSLAGGYATEQVLVCIVKQLSSFPSPCLSTHKNTPPTWLFTLICISPLCLDINRMDPWPSVSRFPSTDFRLFVSVKLSPNLGRCFWKSNMDFPTTGWTISLTGLPPPSFSYPACFPAYFDEPANVVLETGLEFQNNRIDFF